MKNFTLLLSLTMLLGCIGLFCSCNSNDVVSEEQNGALLEKQKGYENGLFKKEDVKLLFSEINQSISINGIDRTDMLSIFRSIFPFSPTRSVESDPVLLINEVGKQHSVFLGKMGIALSMKKENRNMSEILSLFNNDAEKNAVTFIFDVIEKESSFLKVIAEEAAGDVTQTRGHVADLACAVASGVTSMIYAEMATITGVGAAFGGFLGVGASWGAAIIGLVAGVAYTMVFC